MDFFTATADDLKALGWGLWSEESGLSLCPLAQFDNLPDGIAHRSISGDVAVKGRDAIDKDTRFGCIAHGIVPGQTRTDVTANEVATAAAVRSAEFSAKLAALCAESGALDLATGRMMYGEEAAEAMLSIGGKPTVPS